MQNKKTEGVNEEQRSGCAKTSKKKTEVRHVNEQATKKLINAEKQT